MTPDDELFAAARAGDLAAARRALDGGAHVDAMAAYELAIDRERCSGEQPALWIAVERGDEAMVALLLAAGADPDRRDTLAGCGPLLLAARGGAEGIVDRLLAAGADLTQIDGRSDENALAAAVGRGHRQLARRLLSAGAPVTVATLRHALRRGDLELAETCFAHGLEFAGHAAALVVEAANGGWLDALRFLLRRGAPVEAWSSFGWNALHCAVWQGQVAAVEELLAAGADPTVETAQGASALALAEQRGHDAIVALLRRPTGGVDTVSEDRDLIHIGPLRVLRGWARDRARYRAVVLRLVDRLRHGDRGDGHFAAKCGDELEPLLQLWPHVLVVPTAKALGIDDLVRLRAFPVHPLGVVRGWTWADGRPRAPLEFLLHDVDHARFKVREDLLARGIAVPDAYVDGTTFDPATGRHRTFLHHAAPHVDAHGFGTAAARLAFVDGLLAAAAATDRALAQAVRWLLFELVHEKSLPLDPAVLGGALRTTAHVDKLCGKCERRFFGGDGPAPAVVAALPTARRWLAGQLAALCVEEPR